MRHFWDSVHQTSRICGQSSPRLEPAHYVNRMCGPAAALSKELVKGIVAVSAIWISRVGMSQSRPQVLRSRSIWLDWNIRFHQGKLRGIYTNDTISLPDYHSPIVCHNIVLHTFSDNYKYDEIFIRRQEEWISLFKHDCFLTLTPRGSFPEYRPITAVGHTQDTMNVNNLRYRSRYDAQVSMAFIGLLGQLRRADSAGEVPWIYFTDLDTLHLNKSKGIDSLVERLSEGVALPHTAETRLCGNESKYFECLPNIRPLESVNDIAYVIALDSACYNDWMYNCGGILWRPSRLLGAMGQSVLWAFNGTELKHHFDDSDQGRTGLVLRELFDLHPDRVRALCAPFEADAWEPSAEGNELLFTRYFNMTRALEHPVFNDTIKQWFPDGHMTPEEPKAVAIVNARWLNAPACNYNQGYGLLRRQLQLFNCGDMTAHFNGCDKQEYYSAEFRKAVGALSSCIADLPFLTNDANTGPFNYEDWVQDEKGLPQNQPLQEEPAMRMQYGD